MSQFEAILPLKIQDLVALVMQEQHLSFQEALQYAYHSKVMDALAREDLKTWHLSTHKLYEMLTIEKDTNELVFPDFV
jgi:hypothetical protein